MKPYRRSGRHGWYVDLGYVKLPDGSRRRFRGLRCEGRTKADAEEWAWSARARIAQHGPDGPSGKGVPPTVDELFPLYLDRSEKVGGRRGKANAHWLQRQRVEYCGTNGNGGWLRRPFGSKPVDRIDARSLDDLVARMTEAGHEPTHALQVMKGILKLAKRYGHIAELPEFPTVQRPRPARTAYRFDEMARALTEARRSNDPNVHAVLLLGFHAGLYQEEIMGLEREDVNLALGCLHVRRSATDAGQTKGPKTENRVRDIPLTPSLEAGLRAQLSRTPVGVPFLFWRREGGRYRRLKKEWLRWPVRAVLQRAGLPVEEPFRRMRRTFATECKRPARRIPDVMVTRWMGHADQNVTDRHYVDNLPMEDQREIIATLEQPVETLRTGTLGASWEPVAVPERRSSAIAAG
jgi:integrase